MAYDPALNDHKAWLGYLQPEGLVVSATALVDAQVVLDRNATELQQRFLEFVEEVDTGEDMAPAIAEFTRFAREFLGWPDECLLGLDDTRPLPERLIVALPDLNEILRPSLAFVDDRQEGGAPLLLVQLLDASVGLDVVTTGDQAGWSASAGQRFERLLRETGVPIGVLCNGTHLRLVYAPRGESSGSLTWPIRHLTEAAGRPLVGALDMLLSSRRLLTGATSSRLPALLSRSRDYQSQVSTALAGQVLEALYELLRGFQAADAGANGELLREPLDRDPNSVYAGLLAVLMRLVFLLYAEDKGLLPATALYVRNYGVHGLFERLRADRERYADTMDQRYGGWAQLIGLFGAVHAGCRHPEMAMPARQGHLFDPERYPFLIGATLAEPQIPRIPDGCLERVLRNLLILNGERLSYRTLDVEEIGSVYQTIMGFALERVAGTSIAIVGKRKHKSEVAAPVVINLDALLAQAGKDRAKWLKDATGHDWTGKTYSGLKDARCVDELLTILDRRIARHATPAPVPENGLVLQPTDERRRTGSHYTPRKLTEPIVRKTLEPVLARLGEHPTAPQILDLKVCDPAMGSGAFLVEACRQLADELVEAWHHHGNLPAIPPDEDELMLAKRLIAQRCLYGVDKNPMAVDLAKLSLWLATLAKDHPFTFVDHSLRAGDSLVGLTCKQILGFHWQPTGDRVFGQQDLEARIEQAVLYRRRVLDGGEHMSPAEKSRWLAVADDKLDVVRLYGDLVIAAFFGGSKDKERQAQRDALLEAVVRSVETGDVRELPVTAAEDLRSGEHPVKPFHWEIEFPEVFEVEHGGFDAIVGNPPFLKGSFISSTSGGGYRDYLLMAHVGAHGNADLVAHFFREAFSRIAEHGTFGLLATNTIAQGDTRSTGLAWIVREGGVIHSATRRYKWPGQAAVTVSVVHCHRGASSAPALLDGKTVGHITPYLFEGEADGEPNVLIANRNRSFMGPYIHGPGFVFSDEEGATPLAELGQLLHLNPRIAERVFPLIGGEEILDDPAVVPQRRVIYFGQLSEAVARRWPELMALVESKVRPERAQHKDPDLRKRWWQFKRPCPELFDAIDGLPKFLATPYTAKHLVFAFMGSSTIVAAPHVVIALGTGSAFGVLQCRVNELWARYFGSTLEDRLRYAPTDCFETFPFPPNWEQNASLESTGQTYYDFRADLMVRHDEGLTKTYNRFHDPSERNADILRLRELHAEMDRAVLEAYGWNDLVNGEWRMVSGGERIRADHSPLTTPHSPPCGFGLDYLDTDDDELSDEAAALLPEGEMWWPTASEAVAFAAAVGGKKRLPWRYRWPGEVRDEVLARLLALNAERAAAERLAGLAAGGNRGSTAKPGGRGRRQSAGGLFDDEE